MVIKTYLKKKETAALSLKTDSFVVESNVHFPTDYNLLWDASRKSLDLIRQLQEKHSEIKGWRKHNDWHKQLKNLSRALGQTSGSGGKDKQKRLKIVSKTYLDKAQRLKEKLKISQTQIDQITTIPTQKAIALDNFITLMDKHIDLVERRLIKGEKIPHQEKLFSIFEQYTEWVSKGKQNRKVELGKKVSITTDHFGLIIDAYIMENQADSQVVSSTAQRVLSKYEVASWSFDKGYWHKDNKADLQTKIAQVIMPKKGKPNKTEQAEESSITFKTLKHKHSAVESNINELEHCGLDRCPDKGFEGFKRYVSIGIVAYNLKRIGRELLIQEREALQKSKRKQHKKQAA